MNFDLAISEKDGNGGDLQQLGNDLAVVNGIENMPYLAMFGGNREASTGTIPIADAQDYWGNNLFMAGDASIQFNSKTERILNSTELTSAGRVIIENAIKDDLQFLEPQAKITVVVTIEATDRLRVSIRIELSLQPIRMIIINFKKSTSDGDFFISDFTDDFLV